MTREQIIRMAREAGMGGMLTDVVCTHAELERFAALVAAAEREALKAALAEPEQIPPEAQTEAEKVAYCAGWWAAMQKAREVNKPVAYRFQSAVGGWAYGSEPPIGSKYPVYPLYAAPQTEAKHAVPILQKQATKTHGNPTVPAEMWVYAEYLKAHPEQAKEFFQRAGILDTDGNLTEQYK